MNKFDRKLTRILDGACEIFAERGFHNTSIRDIAVAIGVSPAGLYYYFQGKDELLHLILERCLGSLLARLRSHAEGIEDPAHRLRAIVRVHLVQYQENGAEMRVLFREWDTLSGPFGGEIRKMMREYARLVLGTFKELSPGKNPQERRAGAFALFGMLNWVDQWHRPKRDLSLDVLATEFSTIFLEGFLAPDRQGDDEGMARKPSSFWSRFGLSPASAILAGPGF